MILPEPLADVRQLEPGVDQDGVAVAGPYQAAQVFVALGVGLEVVPGGDLKRGDAGAPPAPGKILDVRAAAVGRIEEGPQPARRQRRIETQVAQSVQQVGQPLVPVRTGRRCDPEDGPGTALDSGQERRFLPALARKHAGFCGYFEYGQIQRFLPHDAQFGPPQILDALNLNAALPGVEPERLGHLRRPFEDEKRAAVYPRQVVGRLGFDTLAQDHDASLALLGRRLESERGENPRPTPGVRAGDGKRNPRRRQRSQAGRQSEATHANEWGGPGSPPLKR